MVFMSSEVCIQLCHALQDMLQQVTIHVELLLQRDTI
jgi:hypothetical protein